MDGDIFSCKKVIYTTSHTMSLPIRLGGFVETAPSNADRIPYPVMFLKSDTFCVFRQILSFYKSKRLIPSEQNTYELLISTNITEKNIPHLYANIFEFGKLIC